jgi:hypothetical protein
LLGEQRFRNQVFHPVKASDSIGAFGLASYGEQIRIEFLFLLFVDILYNVYIQDMTELFNRAKLSAAERNFRSHIAQLASGQGLLRGTLSERSSKCGKPNCHCAKGELHQSVYLVQSHAGKLRQICVPKAWRERVRQSVADYQEMQRLIEEVSELEWKRLHQKKP